MTRKAPHHEADRLFLYRGQRKSDKADTGGDVKCFNRPKRARHLGFERPSYYYIPETGFPWAKMRDVSQYGFLAVPSGC